MLAVYKLISEFISDLNLSCGRSQTLLASSDLYTTWLIRLTNHDYERTSCLKWAWTGSCCRKPRHHNGSHICHAETSSHRSMETTYLCVSGSDNLSSSVVSIWALHRVQCTLSEEDSLPEMILLFHFLLRECNESEMCNQNQSIRDLRWLLPFTHLTQEYVPETAIDNSTLIPHLFTHKVIVTVLQRSTAKYCVQCTVSTPSVRQV